MQDTPIMQGCLSVVVGKPRTVSTHKLVSAEIHGCLNPFPNRPAYSGGDP